jgi:hypothetical protein
MHDLFVQPSKRCADMVYSGEHFMEANVRDFIRLIGGVI